MEHEESNLQLDSKFAKKVYDSTMTGFTDSFFPFIINILKNFKFSFIFLVLLSSLKSLEVTIISKYTENISMWFSLPSSFENYSMIKFGIFKLIFLYILIESICRVFDYIWAIATPLIEAKTRITMFSFIQNYKYEFFINNFEGEVENRISEMTDGIIKILEFVVLKLSPSIVTILTILFFLYKTSTLLLLCFLAWTMCHFTFCFFLGKKAARLSSIVLKYDHIVSGFMVESISNTLVKKVFDMKTRDILLLLRKQHMEALAHQRMLKYTVFLKTVLSALYILIPIGILNFLLLKVWYTGLITSHSAVSLCTLVLIGAYHVWTLGDEFASVFEYFGQCFQSLLILKDHNLDPKYNISNDKKPLTAKSLDGSIEFRNVKFKGIIDNISFKIESGQKVAIIGKSGCGKTTLINLILALFEHTSGDIFIGGQNIKDLSYRDIINNISLIPQDSTLLGRSIKENLNCGNKYTKEEIDEALRKVKMYDIINSHKEKHDLFVGNKGNRLSGGQKQRICIARVLLRNPSIVIGDEATSALDPITEKEVIRNMFEVLNKKTVIVVTHKLLSTKSDYEVIICMDKGKIVEMGSPNALLEQKGMYYEMLHDIVD